MCKCISVLCPVCWAPVVLLFSVHPFIEMDSRELQSGAEEVQFIVTVNEDDPVQLFCCLYKDQGHPFSPFSQYLQLDPPTGTSLSFFLSFVCISNAKLQGNLACDRFKIILTL